MVMFLGLEEAQAVQPLAISVVQESTYFSRYAQYINTNIGLWWY